MGPDECVYLFGIVDRDFRIPPSTDGLRLAPLDRIAVVYDVMSQRELAGMDTEVSEHSRLADLARRHDETLRRMARSGPVLPIRLGTVFADPAPMMALLGPAEADLAGELDRVRGRHEWSVRISAGGPTPSEPTAKSGTDYLLGRRDEHRRRDDLAAAIAAVDETLAGWADATAGPGSAGGRPALSRAYLVPDAGAADFAAAVTAAAAELEPRGCQFVLTGPLPPYSFVAVRLGAPSHA